MKFRLSKKFNPRLYKMRSRIELCRKDRTFAYKSISIGTFILGIFYIMVWLVFSATQVSILKLESKLDSLENSDIAKSDVDSDKLREKEVNEPKKPDLDQTHEFNKELEEKERKINEMTDEIIKNIKLQQEKIKELEEELRKSKLQQHPSQD